MVRPDANHLSIPLVPPTKFTLSVVPGGMSIQVEAGGGRG